MRKFINCEIAPANITLKLQDGSIAEFKIYGFALAESIGGVEMICLQPADLRKSPVMRVAKSNVKSLEVQF
jgi:hypothetical protein